MQEQIIPRQIQALLDVRQRFSPRTLNAMREYRRSKPWRGTAAEREAKLCDLHAKLAEEYGLTATLAIVKGGLRSVGTLGRYDSRKNRIVLYGEISVVTYLHVLCIARGFEPARRFSWSLQLFKRMFPRSWANCEFEGLVVRKRLRS